RGRGILDDVQQGVIDIDDNVRTHSAGRRQRGQPNRRKERDFPISQSAATPACNPLARYRERPRAPLALPASAEHAGSREKVRTVGCAHGWEGATFNDRDRQSMPPLFTLSAGEPHTEGVNLSSVTDHF